MASLKHIYIEGGRDDVMQFGDVVQLTLLPSKSLSCFIGYLENAFHVSLKRSKYGLYDYMV